MRITTWILRTLGSLTLLVVVSAALVAAPRPAAAADAVLYEVTETVKEDPAKRIVEDATLYGTANAGTPACPYELLQVYQPGATSCTVSLRGWDEVNNNTGLGTFGGKWIGLIDADNPLDGPERVVLSGDFQGDMDSSPIRKLGLPYGTVTGKLTVGGAVDVKVPTGDFKITAIFRMPFDGKERLDGPSGPTLRQRLCPGSPTPNPHLGGRDFAYLDTSNGQPNGKCIDVLPHELMLNVPLVRFEVTFRK